MSGLGDFVLGGVVGVSKTIDDEYGRINEEKSTIRKEGRARTEYDRQAKVTEEYAIKAEDRRKLAEEARIRYANEQKLKYEQALSTQKFSTIKGGTSPEVALEEEKSRIGESEADAAQARTQQNYSVKGGVDVATSKQRKKDELALKLQDDKARKEAGLPVTGEVSVGIKGLTQVQVRDIIRETMTNNLGVSGPAYHKNLNIQGIPSVLSTIRSGGKDAMRLIDRAINNLSSDSASASDKMVANNLTKELSFILGADVGIKLRDKSQFKGSALKVSDIEAAAKVAISNGEVVQGAIVESWKELKDLKPIGGKAAQQAVSDNKMRTNAKIIATLLGEAGADATEEDIMAVRNSTGYKRIWSLYEKSVRAIIKGSKG